MTPDWNRIGKVLAEDCHRIGNGLAEDCHRIGKASALDWQPTGDRLALDWQQIICLIGTGLALELHRIDLDFLGLTRFRQSKKGSRLALDWA